MSIFKAALDVIFPGLRDFLQVAPVWIPTASTCEHIEYYGTSVQSLPANTTCALSSQRPAAFNCVVSSLIYVYIILKCDLMSGLVVFLRSYLNKSKICHSPQPPPSLEVVYVTCSIIETSTLEYRQDHYILLFYSNLAY